MFNLCVLDLETSISKGPHSGESKDPNNDFYTVIAGTTPENVQVMHKIGGYNRQLPTEAVSLIEKADVIIGHNLSFDLSYVWKNQVIKDFLIRGGLIWDTQVAEYLMSGQRHSFASLAELQLIYLGEKTKESRISQLFKKGIGADVILSKRDTHFRLFSLYEKYSKDDGQSTLKVFYKQYEKAKQMDMLNVIKMYNNYLLTLIQVQNTGIPVDLRNCQETLREFKLKAVDYLKRATDIIKPMWDERLPDFNINSPKDKSAILFGGTYIIKEKELVGKFKNGNDKYKLADKEIIIKGFGVHTSITEESKLHGRYQTGHDVIEKIAKKTNNPQLKEYCELQREAMTYNKMCSTYLEPFLNLSIDGVLYPNYNNTMTITSRLSSSKPNLQNVPSKGDMLVPIQGQLIAPDGWVAVSADYSQLEIYVLAFLSKDCRLQYDLECGIDFHIKRLAYAEDMLYSDVYKLCKEDKLPEWELKRTKAKTISYQKAYGASPSSLAKTTGLDEEVIKKIFTKEDEEYTGVACFNRHVMEQVGFNTTQSYAHNLPKSKKSQGKEGKKFIGDVELLPINDGCGNMMYKSDYTRKIGYYKCVTGKRYSFEEMGRMTRNGIKRNFSYTQTKNYQIQGTAGDVQAASSAALLKLLINNEDKVKMVNEIHDSKWFLIKEEYLSQIIPIIRDKMENIPKHFKEMLDIKMPFKIPVDFKYGNNFAEMSDKYINESCREAICQ